MKSNICVFVGSGDLAIRGASQLSALGLDLVAVCRNPNMLPPIFKGIEADYTRPGSLEFLNSLKPKFLVVTFKPLTPDLYGYKQGFVDAAKNLLDGLGGYIPELVIFVSSTRVFAENEGGWIDEKSPRTKSDSFGKIIVEAEEVVSGADLPLVVLYCSGMYGSTKDYLIKRVKEGTFSPQIEKNYTNRIHRQDVAGVFAWLLEANLKKQPLQDSYIVSDGYPASRLEIELWLAERLGISKTAGEIVSDFSSRGGSKRCDSRLLVNSGYKLLYPDYKSGYESILETSDH